MSTPVYSISAFDETDIKVGDILWYVNDQITSNVEHPHVVIAIDGDWIYTVCGTSKQETIERKAKNKCGGDLSCFPYIRPTDDNSLSRATFFDCLDYYEIHRSKLEEKFFNGEVVKNGGIISYSEYEQIRIALNSNPTIDICDLLIHPNDSFGENSEAAE